MRCPFCKAEDSRVVDSRSADEGNSIRRRRECSSCGKRFTTYETIEQSPLMVVKRDGRRVVFDRDKMLKGLIRSCDKRDIPLEKIVEFIDGIEREIRNSMVREISSQKIGEIVMERLKNFDEVAYIRFASVYRKFADIGEFRNELEDLMRAKEKE